MQTTIQCGFFLCPGCPFAMADISEGFFSLKERADQLAASGHFAGEQAVLAQRERCFQCYGQHRRSNEVQNAREVVLNG